jgi:hypothetical protein
VRSRKSHPLWVGLRCEVGSVLGSGPELRLEQARLQCLTEAVALAPDVDGDGMMEEAIEVKRASLVRRAAEP